MPRFKSKSALDFERWSGQVAIGWVRTLLELAGWERVRPGGVVNDHLRR
jgi:hypothetical protein